MIFQMTLGFEMGRKQNLKGERRSEGDEKNTKREAADQRARVKEGDKRVSSFYLLSPRAQRPPFLKRSFPPPGIHFPSSSSADESQDASGLLDVGRPGVDVLLVRLDERPERALADEVAGRGRGPASR
jgi:hypothetical protein